MTASDTATENDATSWPFVTVVIPMLNESGHIESCLAGLLTQTYPPHLIEVLVIDGGSDDGSREAVEQVSVDHPNVRLIDNPRRLAAAAANIGLAESSGNVLSYLSAHGVPDADYIETSVQMLLETGAVGVGGRYVHEGTDPYSRAIGLAMASPFGMASPHRSSSKREDVDTISHPTFHKQPMIDAGGYDETLLRNEDYEFNYRLRRAGGRLVFCPEISSVYRPRASLRALATQFFAYGRWKATVVRRHPGSLQFRHIVPPMAVAIAATLAVAVSLGRARRIAAAVILAYAALEIVAILKARPGNAEASVFVFMAALPVMHGSWGTGALVGAATEVSELIRRGRLLTD